MWGAEKQLVFEQIKEQLKSDSILIHYDPTKMLIISCDPYPYGLETILSHRWDDDKEQPIMLASRTLLLYSRKISCTVENKEVKGQLLHSALEISPVPSRTIATFHCLFKTTDMWIPGPYKWCNPRQSSLLYPMQ